MTRSTAVRLSPKEFSGDRVVARLIDIVADGRWRIEEMDLWDRDAIRRARG